MVTGVQLNVLNKIIFCGCFEYHMKKMAQFGFDHSLQIYQ